MVLLFLRATQANVHMRVADQREFIKISQAVGMGFLIMVRVFSRYNTLGSSVY